MDREALTRIVIEAVRAQAAAGAEDVGPDTPLGADGLGIDSIGCLDLVLELERRSGIRLRDETLTAESLATPAALIEHLARASRD